MATLSPLDPAISITCESIEFLITEAGRTTHGLTATIHVMNGELKLAESVRLTQPRDCAKFVSKVATALSMAPPNIEAVLRDLLAQAEIALRTTRQRPRSPDGKCPYEATPHGLVYGRLTREGLVPTPLTNFTARIIADITIDDGAETHRELELEACVAGGVPQRFVIPAQHFSGMNWVIEQLGAGALLYPGVGVRDHARGAIQILSDIPPVRRLFAHTGWRRLDGQWIYLHGGGGIDQTGAREDIEVRLLGSLALFRLPAPPTGVAAQEAIAVSLALLDLAPLAVTVPALAAAALAPLTEALGRERPDFTLWFHGPSGARKSELGALIQAFFGEGFTRLSLPMSFTATANALERALFSAKDAVLVVDDYHPANDIREARSMAAVASRLLRGVGNGSGRPRMRADTTLRPDLPPRALSIATGERLPAGHSTAARMFPVPLVPGVPGVPGAIDLERLSRAQEKRRFLSLAMAGYIHWLAGQMEALPATLPAQFHELRQRAQTGGHAREPGQVAHLFLGLDLYLTFATEAGALSRADADTIRSAAWEALTSLAAEHTHQLAAETPVQRFVALLADGFATRRIYLEARLGGPPEDAEAWGWEMARSVDPHGDERRELRHAPNATLIGAFEDEWLLLFPEATYQYVATAARAAGEVFPVELQTLLQRLDEEGLIATQSGRRKPKVRFGDRDLRVIKLRRDALTGGPMVDQWEQREKRETLLETTTSNSEIAPSAPVVPIGDDSNVLHGDECGGGDNPTRERFRP